MECSNINGININVPVSFSGILPVSPNPEYFSYEPYAFFGIRYMLKEGQTAFDVGVSYGVMSTLMAVLVGEKGKVFSFEANPNVIPKANELLKVNSVGSRTNINNYLVCEKSGDEKEFFIIDGFESVASTANPAILNKFDKIIKNKIPSIALDDYCNKTGIIPDFIKLDIEGAEYVALMGASNIIDKAAPDIQIETHGQEIDGIGGNLFTLIDWLEGKGYGIFDLLTASLTNAEEYSKKYSKRTAYLIASKKLIDNTFLNEITENAEEEIKRIEDKKKTDELISNARNAVNRGNYLEAESILSSIVDTLSFNGEANYLYAFCLQLLNKKPLDAIEYYNRALKNGFYPFWVYYNRGTLYASLGKKDQAKEDLTKAKEIDPNHEGVKSLLFTLQF